MAQIGAKNNYKQKQKKRESGSPPWVEELVKCG